VVASKYGCVSFNFVKITPYRKIDNIISNKNINLSFILKADTFAVTVSLLALNHAISPITQHGHE